jgi:rare lipoprotein A
MIVKLFLVLFLFTTSCTVSPRYGASNQVNNKKNIKNNRIKSNGVLRGVSSWYGPNFHGKLTANGEVYDMYGVTAAHKTLTLNTVVRVTNLDNDKSIILRINDRGPYVDGRILDCSFGAAKKLGFHEQGTANVEIKIIEEGDGEYMHH